MSYSFKKRRSSMDVPPIEDLQKTHLVDAPINAIKDNIPLANQNRRAIVIEAPTGSGKSFTFTNYTILEICRQISSIRTIFFVAPSQECVDDPYESMSKFHNTNLDDRLVCVYDQETFNTMIKKNLPPSGDINIVFMTTQFLYKKYRGNDNEINHEAPDLIINDEAHRGLGVPDASTTKEDTGTTNNNWDPRWFRLQEDLMYSGSHILHLTATPTESQRMQTFIGSGKYLNLEPMPKSKETNCFTKFEYAGDTKKQTKTLLSGLSIFEDQVNIIRRLQESITKESWDAVYPRITKMMPGIIISVGRKNAINGVCYDAGMKIIQPFNKKIKGTLFVSTSQEKHFDGETIKRMNDGIKLANSEDYTNKPLIMVVVESGKMGINIPRLLTATVCKIPAQQRIHNNYTQFVARTCRLPFVRDHYDGVKVIKEANISDEQKALLCDYYTMMSTSFAVLPNNTDLMPLVEEFYTKHTFDMEDGANWFRDQVFANYDDKPEGWSVAHDRGTLNRLYRKDYCEAHPNNECFYQTHKGYIKVYGPDSIQVAKQLEIWKKTLQVDHKDGNRYNNIPENLPTCDASVHAYKTLIKQDYLTRYKNGRRIT